MRVEFRSKDMGDLPDVMLIAEDELEWRALQLWMHIMNRGYARLIAEYSYEGKENEPLHD